MSITIISYCGEWNNSKLFPKKLHFWVVSFIFFPAKIFWKKEIRSLKWFFCYLRLRRSTKTEANIVWPIWLDVCVTYVRYHLSSFAKQNLSAMNKAYVTIIVQLYKKKTFEFSLNIIKVLLSQKAYERKRQDCLNPQSSVFLLIFGTPLLNTPLKQPTISQRKRI